MGVHYGAAEAAAAAPILYGNFQNIMNFTVKNFKILKFCGSMIKKSFLSIQNTFPVTVK